MQSDRDWIEQNRLPPGEARSTSMALCVVLMGMALLVLVSAITTG